MTPLFTEKGIKRKACLVLFELSLNIWTYLWIILHFNQGFLYRYLCHEK